MERLTEEKQLGPFASLKDKAEAVPGAFGTYDCFYAHEIAVTRLKEYEDTGLEPEEIMALISPPNPPLTLEELREMDGEPVCVHNLYNGNYEWRVVDVMDAVSVWFTDGEARLLTRYGSGWLTYRRKPEEGTTWQQ